MDNRITIDPKVCHGQACIRGTRIPRASDPPDARQRRHDRRPAPRLSFHHAGRHPRLLRLCSTVGGRAGDASRSVVGQRMKIMVDEHIPLMTLQALRMAGHDVRDIRGTSDQGMPDDALWDMAQLEERLLITTDRGFMQYRALPHCGMLIVRLRWPNRHRIHERIMRALRQFSDTEWPGLLVVMRDVAQSAWRSRENP